MILKSTNVGLLFCQIAFAIVTFAQNPVKETPQGDQKGIPFESNTWAIKDADARTMTYLGQPSLYLYRGWAEATGVDFQDGTIECDVAFHGHGSFAGLLFRSQSEQGDLNSELIYLRPHHSRLSDAVQYAPLFTGQDSWQLYNGPGYTANAEIPLNRWVHLRLEVDGQAASLFVDGSVTPSLVVASLRGPAARGRVGLWGRLGGATFSNFKVTPRLAKILESFPPSQPALSGTIIHWRLSPVFETKTWDSTNLLAIKDAPSSSWERVTSEPGGLLNISRYRKRISPLQPNPTRNQKDTVYVKAMLRSPNQRSVPLLFGYSDSVSVFLNGKLLFTGSSKFLSRDPSFLGIIGLHDSLQLDLKAGVNELVFAVTERDSGWGLMARFPDFEGFEIE